MAFSLKQAIAATPTPLAGLALGIVALGFVVERRLALSAAYRASAEGFVQHSAALISTALIALIVIKFLLKPRLLSSELAHPIIGSVVPTLAMSLMLISAAVGHFWPWLAVELWYSAVFLHLLLLLIFLWHQLRGFLLNNMVPSWFVPPIGVAVAGLTCPSPAEQELARYIVYFAMACFVVMMVPMLHRLIFAEEVVDAAKPTIAVLAAPASLLLAAYLNVEPEPSLVLVSSLLGIALLMTCLIYLAFFHLLRLPFSPAYSAFTFPMVISASALQAAAAYVHTKNPAEAELLQVLADIELLIAVAVVVYVAVLYLRAFCLQLSRGLSFEPK
ncbi:TDT family transporter [Agaribacterium haliotis]|uniref:TDT family transporter n=1 Tax=Agaribacterium haliotis TaxID=2013869 RepID=UPI000BB57FE7|nr:TDT family transporter [Agaribacterium haliotis]